MKKPEKITPRTTNFAKWYVDVITQADLMNYGPIKGTIYFKPLGYKIWENIVKIVNAYFVKQKIENVYFPLLIPQDFIEKEKKHIEGFAPELLTITKVGGKNLVENIYIRPTSELLFADYFKAEIAKNNILPIKLNQWSQVLRWEKTTNPFLRNTEFLWQEGHTIHASKVEADQFAKKIARFYKYFLENYLAIPVISGQKTEREKFAGAVNTYTVEAMMQNFRALQSATAHFLGQNFAKNFEIFYKNKENKSQIPFQTSWGLSTRLIGAIVMVHSDDNGLIFPPKIAPIQVDILEFFSKKNQEVKIFAKKIAKILKNAKISYKIDDTDQQIGYKINNSEVHGAPIRIEIGPNEVKNNQICLVRRDNHQKFFFNIDLLKEKCRKILEQIQADLFKKAKIRLLENTVFVNSINEFEQAIKNNKFVIAPFSESPEREQEIQEKTGATARCILPKNSFFALPQTGNSIFSGEKTNKFVLFAKSY
ncbi:proline--tRNA ligase [Mesomycoplasma hyopneumoniae]|uniref:proline--tRNA ligase n=1 Tax=Mesomycoplasma hyopneumoniae TaxID=2099 RepID=UPI0032666E4E